MFPFRLWRRIHRPFLFLIFACSSLLLLTNVSVVSTVVPSSHATKAPPSVHASLDEANVMTKIGLNQELFQDDHVSIEGEDSAEDLVPATVVHQLPFCGQKKSTPPRGKRSTRKNAFAQHLHPGLGLNDSDTDTATSEEIVVKNSGSRNVVVATLDGRVSLLDAAGKILWSVCTGQLFSSTISSLQLTERGKFIKLIPSLTGGLYKYDGISLEAMPMNADSLLKRSFKLAQDVVITGGKEFRTFGVDIDTGLVKYECGISGCKSPTTADAEVTSAEESSGIVLVIKKTLQTVRAIDSVTGTERWNFSVGTHELALAGVTEGCYEAAGDSEERITNLDPHHFKMVIADGLIFGTDEEKHVLWKYKFDSPIAQAWIMEDSALQILDPIKAHGLLEDAPSLYVGMHRHQLYVQESQAIAKKLMGLLALEETNSSDLSNPPLQLSWRPTTSILAPSQTTAVEETADSESRALAPLYPAPFFVYERDAVRAVPSRPAIEAPPGQTVLEEVDDDIEEVNLHEEEESVDTRVIMAVATLWFWWKEILGISLLTAVILNVILLRPVVYLTRRRTIAEVVHQVNMFLRRNREQQQQLALMPPPVTERSTSSATLEASGSSPSTTHLRFRTFSNSSGLSNGSDEQVSFVSQYLREFDPVQYIGKGAFGTVFEAKKKIDDRSYAVKRITLPNREKSRDRVMREVKALARLDHKNIVRYFNAWIENPPSGWLEKNDPLWNAFILNSPSPTCDNYPSSFTCDSKSEFSMNANSWSIAKKQHSEIHVAETPDEDSFIVFEQESSREVSCLGTVPPSSRILQESIAEESASDWLEESRNDPTPIAENRLAPPLVSETESKFFRRPTTLDIPSSGDCDELLQSESEVGGGSSPCSSVMYLYIQQELCQKRTLQDWLRCEPRRVLAEAMGMFYQLVEAVEYIHANCLIHRDLKPGNIFLAGGNGSPENEITVKIGDFGLATTLACDRSCGDMSTFENEPSDRPSAKLTGQVGTQLYMAPEQAQRKAYDHKVDIFSLGLIFFELLVPLSTDMEKHTELHKLRQMKFPPHFVKSFPDQFELIQDMVSHDPNSRPDASEIKSYLSKGHLHHHGNTFRSRSYPEHLMNPSLPPSRGRKGEKERILYKTHSAM